MFTREKDFKTKNRNGCTADCSVIGMKTFCENINHVEFYKQLAIAEDNLRKNPNDKETLIKAAKLNLYFGNDEKAKKLSKKAKVRFKKRKIPIKHRVFSYYSYDFLFENKPINAFLNMYEKVKDFFSKFRKKDLCFENYLYPADDDEDITFLSAKQAQPERNRYVWNPKIEEKSCTRIINEFKNGKSYLDLIKENINKNEVLLLEQLLKINPHDPILLGKLAMALYENILEPVEGIRILYQSCKNKAVKHGILHNAYVIYHYPYAFFMAKSMCNKALELRPDFFELKDFMKQKLPLDIKLKDNYYEKLIQKEQELQNNPDDCILLKETAYIFAKFGRFYKAVEYLSKSLYLRGFWAEVGFNFDMKKYHDELTNSILGLSPLPKIFLLDDEVKKEYEELSKWLKKIDMENVALNNFSKIENNIDNIIKHSGTIL